MSSDNNNNEAVAEDQLRSECYELHALRSEVADLLNVQRDVECRFEYLRTVMSNLDRNEDHLKKTLAYEAATSDAVLHAACNGQPLPPALAADAATSVLAPPVHLGPNNKNLFQSPGDLAESRDGEMRQLRKEIADMETVICAERRSIGALQHAMYAQGAFGDTVVRDRRKSNASHKEILQEVSAAQSQTKSIVHHEDVLKKRLEQQLHEMNLKTRRLQELDDLKRIYALQLEEMRNAVIVGRRDLIRAQTLESECRQVSTVAQGKMENIAWSRKNNKGSLAVDGSLGGDVEALAHASGPMFVSALGGGAGRPVGVTGGQQQQQQTANQLATGTQRYNKNLYGMDAVAAMAAGRSSSSGSRRTGSGSPIAHHRRAGTASSSSSASQKQQQQQQQQQDPAMAVAQAAMAAPFGWTSTPGQTQPGGHQHQQQTFSPEQRKKQIAAAYSDANADANEWLRRYVGSMRGLHLTALETSIAVVE